MQLLKSRNFPQENGLNFSLLSNNSMMNWFLTSFITLVFFPLCIDSQQKYFGNAVLDCTSSDESNPSESFLYTCNGEFSSCKAFLIFTARFPYNTVPAIATLISSDQTEIAKINNVTRFSVFKTEQEVIVPVNCSCSNQYYQANTTYQVPMANETYYVIANDTYQGLSTCYSIKRANTDKEFSLQPGIELQVPLQCACPTSGQTASGTKYLLTYSVGMGDTLYILSKRFNVSVVSIREANSFSDEHLIIYPFTTILIPMLSEPSSSHTSSTRGYKLMISPPLAPVARKTRSKRVMSTAGIAAGALSLLLLIVLLVIFLFYKNRTRVQQTRGRNAKISSPGELIVEIARFKRALKVFKFNEIKKATGNFSPRRRIKGYVYRGTFGREVWAVKKISRNSQNEVKMLCRINHFNIVKLHGFCEYKDNTYLVYEYMKNGSLQEWLSKRGSADKKNWNQRIQIALDVANGLLYLHNFTKPACMHSDIRSSNVLLDSNLRAKIANFSLARTLNSKAVTTQIVGAEGYKAPECIDTRPSTPKIDVYAFGVVLLELITGKHPVFMQDGLEKLLSTEIATIMASQDSKTELSHFIESCLGENGGIEYAIQVAKLSLNCLKQDPANRPDMVEIVSVLLKLQFNLQKSIIWYEALNTRRG